MHRFARYALTGLGLVLTLAPLPAHAFGDCSDPAYVATLDGATPTSTCEERETFSLVHGRGTSAVRVVSLTSATHGEDGEWIARVERNLAGIGAAMQSMGAVGTGEITIVLVGKEDAEGNEGEAGIIASAPDSARSECAVSIYKEPEGYTERHFDFLLAHEIFHCAQFVTFGLISANELWWAEGSAEHFAHMAVPDAGDFDWYADFDRRSTTEPLTAMQYENVVFFHWLNQQVGPDGVARFLAALAAQGDAALRTWVDTQAWAAFTEALVEGRIRSPGGVTVPAATTFTGDYIVDDTVDLPIDIAPYVASRYKLRFDKEKHFEVRLGTADGALVRLQDDAATWSDLPLFVSTCPDAVTRIAYGVTADAPTAATISFVKLGTGGAAACCLEGTWTATPETLAGLASFGAEQGGPAAAMAGGEMSCSYSGGAVRLTFAGDGYGALTFDGHATACTARMHGQSITTTGTRSGSFDFTWTVADGEAGRASYTGNSVVWTMAIKLGPVVQTMSNPDAGPSTRTNGFAFACTETTLDILGLYGLSTFENRFTRPPRAP
ncbi:MAG: hypothetical protein B7Z31_10940 [Rhodobacterales bacterium 12-65-15]|nr:MAG: hypothetical protein B7Z31_10940 [Rhodobacterales bacterium 12-65-15]